MNVRLHHGGHKARWMSLRGLCGIIANPHASCNLALPTAQEPGNMTNTIHSSCPKCGAPIPENAPQGLCPKCVLRDAATLLDPPKSPAGKTPAPTVAELAPHFPELEILELIGAGGMGAVYKARQPKLDRFVALKILAHDLAVDPAFTERFNREARVLARLNHQNIVTVFDFGTAGPFCFLLMEYVDGVNLRQAMRAGGFTPTETLNLVQDICTALKFAHETGILHRDIKPENVLIDSRGRVKIADFGIAKLLGKDERDDVTLTHQGAILGTPHYMAPEQIETPGEVDQRADIYSLGVVFYELLTRELPIGRFAPPSERSPMDPRIDVIVMRALEKDRKARYQTVGEVKTQVEAITHSRGEVPKAASGAPAAPVAAPASKPETARFATASAVLTALSLLLTAVAVCAYFVFENMRDWSLSRGGQGLVPGANLILFAVSLLVVGVPAILGIILGSKALAEVRLSNGRKTGLGSAIFATVAWPSWLILFPLGMASQFFPLPLGGRPFGVLTMYLVVLIPALVAACLLGRSLYRWAGGVEHKDGTRFHPGLGIPLLMVMLVTFGGSVLLSGIVQLIVPAGEHHDALEESQEFRDALAESKEFVDAVANSPELMGVGESLWFGETSEELVARFDRRRREENIRSNAKLAKTEGSGLTAWYRGGPEVHLQLEIHPRYRAEFRLVQYEGGDPKKKADVGTWVPPSKPDSNPRLDDLDVCHVFVGTSKPQGDVPNVGVTVQLGRNKESGNFSTTETDFTKWQWHYEKLINLPPLANAQRESFVIASREESVDGKSKVTGILGLEVQLIERKP